MDGVGFPDRSVEEVHAAVAARWDLAGPFPIPRDGWLACPVCRAETPQIRHWQYHKRDEGTIPWRCDVSFKCVDCSAVWIHGVVVPGDYYDHNATRSPKRVVGWREGRRLLEDTHEKA